MSSGEAAIGRVRVLFGVCGSIAGVAVPHLVFWMKRALAISEVQVILTGAAEGLLGRRSIEAVLGHRALVDWEDWDDPSAPHVSLGDWADVVVVLPATANLLSKVAHGGADDLLSSTLLATTAPVILAPAMNAAMWEKPAVARNVAQLRADGYEVIEPASGVELQDGSVETGSLGDFRPVLVTAVTRAVLRNQTRDAPTRSATIGDATC